MKRFVILVWTVLSLAGVNLRCYGEAPASAPGAVDVGATDGGKPQSQVDRASYTLGAEIGRNFRIQGAELNLEVFVKGLKDGLKEGDVYLLTIEEMREAMTKFQMDLQRLQEKRERELAEKNAKEGKEFLTKNGKQRGVRTTKSGLQYKVLKEGPRGGKSPKATDTVVTHYTGRLLDGTVFDSSVERGQPSSFRVAEVIKGWTEALQLMKPGDKWELYIPADLAYGEMGAGGRIPPNAVLIFELELLSINEIAGGSAQQ